MNHHNIIDNKIQNGMGVRRIFTGEEILKFYVKLLAPLHILNNFGGTRISEPELFSEPENSAPLEAGEGGGLTMGYPGQWTI